MVLKMKRRYKNKIIKSLVYCKSIKHKTIISLIVNYKPDCYILHINEVIYVKIIFICSYGRVSIIVRMRVFEKKNFFSEREKIRNF